jgi:hypothetical protein
LVGSYEVSISDGYDRRPVVEAQLLDNHGARPVLAGRGLKKVNQSPSRLASPHGHSMMAIPTPIDAPRARSIGTGGAGEVRPAAT